MKTISMLVAVVLIAGAFTAVLPLSISAASADINNPKGDIKFQNTKTVIVNLKVGKDGKNGKDGTNGADGVNGRDGTNGIDGTNGTNGQDGAPGLNGLNGTNGQDGAPGRDGTNGTNGVDGQNGRDGTNGTNGVNGVDGRDGQMVLILNVTNGQHIVCSATAGGDIGCIDTSDNGTVIIPPTDNETGGGGNTTEPVVCGENETNVNGTCVTNTPPIEDNGSVVIPPNDTGVIPPVINETGNETGPVIVDNSTGTVVIDNNTNGTG